MLIDVFPFSNEFKVLKARLNYLANLVDVFVLVESDITYSGIAKRMLFSEMRAQFGGLNEKILVIPQHYRGSYDFKTKPKNEDDTNAPQHLMEKFQRDGALEALRGMPPDAVIMIGDVDEIPSIPVLTGVLNDISTRSASVMATSEIKPYPPVVFAMDHYLYSPSNKVKQPWLGTVVTTNNLVNALAPSRFRADRAKMAKVEGGWHLDNFTSPEGIQVKFQSFAHQNLNDEKYTNLEHIKKSVENGKDVFARRDYKTEQVAQSTIPTEITKNLE